MPRIFLNSIILWMGVIVLAPSCVAASSLWMITGDTLIIDSDTIYIEQDQVQLPEDSLPGENVKRSRVPSNPWSASLSVGVNVTHPEILKNSVEFQPLNDFIGLPYKLQPNVVAGADLGYRFLSIPGNQGTIELAAISGYQFNKVKMGFSAVDNPLELTKDSLLFFKEESGELLMGYFFVTGQPSQGEADSTYIFLRKAKLNFQSHDVSVKLRATLSNGPRRTRFFFETGIVKRFTQGAQTDERIYFINGNGSYKVVEAQHMKVRSIIVPHFAIGAEKRVDPEINQDTYLTLGASFSASLPAAAFYGDDYFDIEIRSYALQVFARYFF